jgi:hypothetical protein
MKTGRNDPCPCGSGKKYKKCCLSVAEQLPKVSGESSASISFVAFVEGNNIDYGIATAYYSQDVIDLSIFKVSELALLKNLTEIIQAIDLCIKSKYLLSALKLIYSAIDNMAFLWADIEYTTPTDFKRFADSYILQNSDLDCTSDELYIARCGLLHQNTANNRKLSPGTRYIFYSWGTYQPNQGPEHVDALTRDQCTFVSIHSLRDALYKGMLNFLKERSKESSLKEKLLLRSQKYFAIID